VTTTIATAFKAALEQALASHPEPKVGENGVTADALVTYLRDAGVATVAIREDLLAVITEIQRRREADRGLDHFLRQRGIVTRAREVR
jgi:hypothetical protein